MKKKIFSIMVLTIFTAVLYADAPAWFIPLRDAVYEQGLASNEVLPIYNRVKSEAEAISSEVERYIILARIENLMGQIYQWEGRNTEAAAYYEQGESYAQSALNLQHTSEAWYVHAESIALQCDVKGFAYQVANGMRFVNSANRAINFDPHNAAAKYLLAAMYAFPNPPFRNLRRAQNQLEEIIKNDNEYMSKDTRFNVYYAMGVVNQKQRKPTDARIWFERALSLYPTNKDVQNRLGEL